MAAGIAAFGERGFSGSFGAENNEIHRKFYLLDPANQFVPLLQRLFGTYPNLSPEPFPSPFGTFYAYSLEFRGLSDQNAQGDTGTAGSFALLSNFPKIRGGLEVDVTFRPMDISGGYGFQPVTDEGWDFSAQTLSLIGNNYASNPSALTWQSDDTPITNLTAIVKLIPKIELVQRRIFVAHMPTQQQIQMIGRVNAAQITIGADPANNQWPPQTVLLVGLPSIRRWRFDGVICFEIGIKMAINMTYDHLIDQGTDGYVTWNRLYRPGSDSVAGGWDQVLVGEDSNLIYRTGDLAQITGIL